MRNIVSRAIRKSAERRLGAVRRAADAARDARRWPEAASGYRTYLEASPTATAIWVQLGHALKESGDREGAERSYRAAIALAPDDADAHLHLGHALKLLGRSGEAAEAYARAAALGDPRAAEERAGLAPPPPDARERENARPDMDDADALRQAGDAARDAQDWGRAAEAYSRYLQRRPGDAGIQVQLGHALRESGRLEAAEAAYRAALSIEPDAPDTLFFVGRTLHAMGRLDEAGHAWRRAAALDPADPRVQEALAALNAASRGLAGADAAEIVARLAAAEEQILLMQGQSRAIRILSGELVKARNEIKTLRDALAETAAKVAAAERATGERLARLEQELARARAAPPGPDPATIIAQHFAQRRAARDGLN